MESLPDTFYAMAKQITETDSQVAADCRLEKKGKNWILRIPKQDESGFDIEVIAEEHEVTVYTEHGAHQHFTSDGNHAEIIKEALGLARDLLSETMRVRVYEIRGKPYRFDLEWFKQGRWQKDGTTGLFILPWFGKKTEKVYSNKRLPPRNYD